MGTDEITFCGIVFNRSNAHLRAIVAEYKHQHRHSLEHAIVNEFSGLMEHALLYAIESALHPIVRDVRLLEAAIAGEHTKDERLTYRTIRAYWEGGQPHVQAIKAAYHERYGHDLIKRVKEETSGDFGRLLVAILEG